MEKHIFWLQIITILMQLVIIFINTVKEKLAYTKSIKKERYTKFHTVYIQLLFTDYILDRKPSDQEFKVIRDYFLCIRDNIMYVGEATLQHHEGFIKSLFEVIDFDYDDPANFDKAKFKSNPILKKEFDESFRQMTLSILEESQNLAHAIELPNIGKTFQEKFSAMVF